MEDKTDPRTKFEQWKTRYQMGILHIYIDDMDVPMMSTFVNIGEMINRDNFYTPNAVAG